jgi:hypothetical protein
MIKWIDELDSAVSAHKRQFGTSPRTERISPDRYRHAALLLEDAVIHRQPMTTDGGLRQLRRPSAPLGIPPRRCNRGTPTLMMTGNKPRSFPQKAI